MTKNKLSKLIEKHQAKREQDTRNYIGASIIGSDCLRQIWYEFKGFRAEEVPTKTCRTWDIGKSLEGLVIDWLTKAGVKVDKVSETYRARNVPVFQGHFDGLVYFGKKQSILEVKTAKDASFKVFVKKGVKAWYPIYYAQVQSYMGLSGINSTYILALNKDNSDLADELVLFDGDLYKKLEEKALMISNAIAPPPRVHGSPLWYQCKLCKFNKICHK